MDFKEFKVDNQLIRIPIPTGYADCFTLINSDQYRWTGKKKSKVSLILDIFKPFYPTVLFWKRLSQYPARVINYDNPGQFIKNPFDAGFKN